jgi:pectinesterase
MTELLRKRNRGKRGYLPVRSVLVAGGLMICLLARGQVFNMVVSADGTGDYTTIQAALDALPDNSADRTLIFVCAGTYKEKVVLGPAKIKVSLIGEDPERVVIVWDDYAGKYDMSSADTYTFWADADDFYAENISFVNTAGPVGQALAIRTTGERMVFKNCYFTGHQDTYYAHQRRQYNLLCRISGTTDFIYGDATTVFEKCVVQCRKGGSYITAPADTKLVSKLPDQSTFYHGLLFRDCDILADEDVPPASYYLGRPWQPNASSVYIRCRMGDHIKPAGWSIWSDDNHLSGCFAEYLSVDLDGNLLDVSGRVAWSKQLNAEEVQDYYNPEYFLEKTNVIWDPIPITWSLPSPGNILNDGSQLSWDEVPGAIGYVVFMNDSAIGFTESASFDIHDIPATENLFSLKSISENGNLSGFPNEPALYTGPVRDGMDYPVIRDRQLIFPEKVDFRIYSLNGRELMAGKKRGRADLSCLGPGIYIVFFTDGQGIRTISKIALRSF